MLQENSTVRQHPGEPRRRFFWDDYFQLFVWLDEADAIVGFELSYDLQSESRAFRWTGEDVRHYRVDDGESRAMKKAVAVLRDDPHGVEPAVLKRFLENSGQITPRIATFVYQRLRRYFLAREEAAGIPPP